MEKYLNKKGFTLVELVIAMGIFSILFTVVIGIYLTMLRAYTGAQVMATIQQEGRISTEVLARFAKEAQSATIDSATDPNCHEITFNFPIGSSPESVSFHCGSGKSFVMEFNGEGPTELTTSSIEVKNFKVVHPISPTGQEGFTITYPKAMTYSLELGPPESSPSPFSRNLKFEGLINMRSEI